MWGHGRIVHNVFGFGRMLPISHRFNFQPSPSPTRLVLVVGAAVPTTASQIKLVWV
jgi:hypothetical protein